MTTKRHAPKPAGLDPEPQRGYIQQPRVSAAQPWVTGTQGAEAPDNVPNSGKEPNRAKEAGR
ncbi:MAG: hypothetical protein GY847_01170 [Proteobacteria bacterium]|nr:hypothetical protein [Pseudomonadota bacterium]